MGKPATRRLPKREKAQKPLKIIAAARSRIRGGGNFDQSDKPPRAASIAVAVNQINTNPAIPIVQRQETSCVSPEFRPALQAATISVAARPNTMPTNKATTPKGSDGG